LRVAFLLRDLQLRPGVGTVVAHAAALRADSIDAHLVLTREQEHRHWPYPGLAAIPVLPFASASSQRWDVAIASGGATASPLLDLTATRHACLLVEDDLAGGVCATSLPLCFLAPTRAAAALIEALQPGNAALHVAPPPVAVARAAVPPATAASPLRVLAVGDVAAVLAAVSEPVHATLVAWSAGDAAQLVRPAHEELAAAVAASDVVLALDDGGDPYDTILLAVALGVPVITTTVPGREEVVVDRANGMLVGVGDVLGAAGAVDALARDRGSLAPRPAPAPPAMAAALRRLLDEPPPPAGAVARRVAADLATADADAEALRWRLERDLAHARARARPAAGATAASLKAQARRAARAAKRRLRR
jgi:glycosyltransferase involved in cell wall biosynthesis